MGIFDRSVALEPAVKARIRHLVLARVQRVSMFGAIGDRNDIDAYLAIAGLLTGLVGAPALALWWSGALAISHRLGAVVVALVIVSLAILAVSEKALGRFERYTAAIYLVADACTVFAIRSLPSLTSHVPTWLMEGAQSGLAGALAIFVAMTMVFLGAPLFQRLGETRRKWSIDPEAHIVSRLLEILGYLEELNAMPTREHEGLLQAMANEQVRAQAIASLGAASHSSVKNTSEGGAGRNIETYELRVRAPDGAMSTVLKQEHVFVTRENVYWQTVRVETVRAIEEVARFIERGLPARLSKRGIDGRLDEWARHELKCKAETVRAWAREVLLPSHGSIEKLLPQIVAAIEHSAEEQWGALASSEAAQTKAFGKRLWQSVRKSSVGAIPLAFLLVAPVIGIVVPAAVRDSLLTFAVPWLLLQLIELIAPDGGEFLSRTKGLRDLLPKSS